MTAIQTSRLRAAVLKLQEHTVSGYEWDCACDYGADDRRRDWEERERDCPHIRRHMGAAAISRDEVLALIDRLGGAE